MPPSSIARFKSPRRWKWLTRAVAAAGLGAALVLYFVAGPEPENPLGYDPLDTKLYRHDLELYGGQANVLAAEFREWFAGLWYGRNLAYTVAFLTIAAVVAIRFFTARAPARQPREARRRDAP